MARRSVRIRDAAREALGYDRLRPGQEEAIAAILQGRDALAVLSTGSGKSAIYQVAGLHIELGGGIIGVTAAANQARTWSCCSAMSGDTTTVGPSSCSPATW